MGMRNATMGMLLLFIAAVTAGLVLVGRAIPAPTDRPSSAMGAPGAHCPRYMVISVSVANARAGDYLGLTYVNAAMWSAYGWHVVVIVVAFDDPYESPQLVPLLRNLASLPKVTVTWVPSPTPGSEVSVAQAARLYAGSLAGVHFRAGGYVRVTDADMLTLQPSALEPSAAVMSPSGACHGDHVDVYNGDALDRPLVDTAKKALRRHMYPMHSIGMPAELYTKLFAHHLRDEAPFTTPGEHPTLRSGPTLAPRMFGKAVLAVLQSSFAYDGSAVKHGSGLLWAMDQHLAAVALWHFRMSGGTVLSRRRVRRGADRIDPPLSRWRDQMAGNVWANADPPLKPVDVHAAGVSVEGDWRTMSEILRGLAPQPEMSPGLLTGAANTLIASGLLSESTAEQAMADCPEFYNREAGATQVVTQVTQPQAKDQAHPKDEAHSKDEPWPPPHVLSERGRAIPVPDVSAAPYVTSTGPRFFVVGTASMPRADGDEAQQHVLQAIDLRARCAADPSLVVIDVGGLFGELGLYSAASGCRTITFEPQQRYAEQIAASVVKSGLQKLMTVHHAAVSPTDELQQAKGAGLAHFLEAGKAASGTVDTVPGEQIDVELGQQTALLVKIDVEGFEGQVLATMKQTLEAGRVKNLILEFTPKQFEGRGTDYDALLPMLRNAGADKCLTLHRREGKMFHVPWSATKQFTEECYRTSMQTDLYCIFGDKQSLRHPDVVNAPEWTGSAQSLFS